MSSLKTSLLAWTVLGITVLGIIPTAQAQIGPEDFEDDTIGTTPTGSFYTFVEVEADPAVLPRVESIVGTQALRVSDLGGSQSGGASGQGKTEIRLDLNTAAQHTTWTFDVKCDTAANQRDMRVQLTSDTGQLVWESAIGEATSNCRYRAMTGAGFVDLPSSAFHTWQISFDWSAKTFTSTIDGNAVDTNRAFSNGAANNIGKLVVKNAANCLFMSDTCGVYLDNLNAGAGAAQPRPPAGVSAVVIEGKTTSDPGESGTVHLRWSLSPDDPDREQGSFTYSIYQGGILIGPDATTSADGDGVRFHELSIGGNAPGSPSTFTITATDPAGGLTSVFSCSVTIDTSKNADLDTCGAAFPGSGIGGVDFTTDTDTAAGLKGFCSSLLGDSSGSLFLCGLIFVSVVFLGMAAAFGALIPGGQGLGAAVAGTIGGFGMMVFNVFAGVWSLVWGVVLIILTSAVITALVRRIFMGRGGGDG